MEILFLLLSIFFIIVFFVLDNKEWPDFSIDLWVPFLWLTISSTRILSIFFPLKETYDSLTQNQYLEGNIYNRIIFSSLILVGLLIISLRMKRLKSIPKANIWLIILYLFALMSIFWSIYQFVSLKRWIMIMGHFVMVIIILMKEDYIKAIEHVLRRYFSVIVVFSVLVLRYFKDIGFQRTVHGTKVWAGIMTHKNELGPVCAFAIIFVLWRLFKKDRKNLVFDSFLLLLSLYLMTRAGSASSIIILFLGAILLFLFYIFSYSFKKIKIIAFLLTVLIIIPLLWQASLNKAVSPILLVLGRESSLTGRVPLWTDLIKIANKKWMFGSGFENFWLVNFSIIWQKYSFRPNNAHNGYIEIYLNLGITGLCILIILLFVNLSKLVKQLEKERNVYVLIFIYFLMVLINNISEAFFFKTNLEWFIVIVASFVGGRELEVVNREEGYRG